MKKLWLVALLVTLNVSLYSMESDIVKYDNIPFITPEQMQNQLPAVPADIHADVAEWDTTNGDIIEEFAQLPTTPQAYHVSKQRRAHFKQPGTTPQDIGKGNHIFKTKKAIVRAAGLQNAAIERISAMGADPYNNEQVARVGGLEQALATDKPRQQSVSRLLAARMIQQLNSPAIKTPEVWAYSLSKEKQPLDDRNYVIVQKQFPVDLKTFDSLTAEQKKQVFKYLPLSHLYNAMKYSALWQFKGNDVYVNPENIQEIWLVDLEKPNNEAYDQSAARGQRGNAFRNVALYGKDKDKWKFNVYEHAFPQIKNWIQQNAPERVAEWNQLKAADPDA